VAAGGLFLEGDRAFVTLLQSDLCQQIYRSADLKAAASARLNNRFRYWDLMLVNAILDVARDAGLTHVHAPTAATIVGAIRKPIAPDLFTRVYDAVGARYVCARERVDAAEYWTIPLAANADRIVHLRRPEADAPAAPRDVVRPVICVCHDIEEDVDTAVAPADCRAALDGMLAIEAERGVGATYAILGRIFARAAPLVRAAGRHSVAFHSFDHRHDDCGQLPRVREVDLQVQGYRPPRSVITAELSAYDLAYWNFEWLLSSARSLGIDEPRLEHGIAKIPVALDDYPLHTGTTTRAAWIERLRREVASRPFVAVGLHDCYAREWLDWYPDLLAMLAEAGELCTVDDVVHRLRFATAL
jgi:hypothetical protein